MYSDPDLYLEMLWFSFLTEVFRSMPMSFPSERAATRQEVHDDRISNFVIRGRKDDPFDTSGPGTGGLSRRQRVLRLVRYGSIAAQAHLACQETMSSGRLSMAFGNLMGTFSRPGTIDRILQLDAYITDVCVYAMARLLGKSTKEDRYTIIDALLMLQRLDVSARKLALLTGSAVDETTPYEQDRILYILQYRKASNVFERTLNNSIYAKLVQAKYRRGNATISVLPSIGHILSTCVRYFKNVWNGRGVYCVGEKICIVDKTVMVFSRESLAVNVDIFSRHECVLHHYVARRVWYWLHTLR